MSFPTSVTGQVFATVRALDTTSTSASPSECIMLLPEAETGPQAFQEMFVYVSAEESHQSMDYGRMVQLFFLAFLYSV